MSEKSIHQRMLEAERNVERLEAALMVLYRWTSTDRHYPPRDPVEGPLAGVARRVRKREA